MHFANAYFTLGLAEECLRNITVLLMCEDLCRTGYSTRALNGSNIAFYQAFRNITIQEIVENLERGGLLVDLLSFFGRILGPNNTPRVPFFTRNCMWRAVMKGLLSNRALKEAL